MDAPGTRFHLARICHLATMDPHDAQRVTATVMRANQSLTCVGENVSRTASSPRIPGKCLHASHRCENHGGLNKITRIPSNGTISAGLPSFQIQYLSMSSTTGKVPFASNAFKFPTGKVP